KRSGASPGDDAGRWKKRDRTHGRPPRSARDTAAARSPSSVPHSPPTQLLREGHPAVQRICLASHEGAALPAVHEYGKKLDASSMRHGLPLPHPVPPVILLPWDTSVGDARLTGETEEEAYANFCENHHGSSARAVYGDGGFHPGAGRGAAPPPLLQPDALLL